MRISILFFVMSFMFYLIQESKHTNIVFEREYKIKMTTMEEINYYSTIYSKKYNIFTLEHLVEFIVSPR